VTRIAVDKKVAKPVKAEIKLPEGATIVSGEREVDLGHLADVRRSRATAGRAPASSRVCPPTTPGAWNGS
jgi:hypothetical protein